MQGGRLSILDQTNSGHAVRKRVASRVKATPPLNAESEAEREQGPSPIGGVPGSKFRTHGSDNARVQSDEEISEN